jgi:hypothetical protein
MNIYCVKGVAAYLDYVQSFKILYALHSRWEAKILNLNSNSTTQACVRAEQCRRLQVVMRAVQQ